LNREAFFSWLRSTLPAQSLVLGDEPLATLGEWLALTHWTGSFSGMPDNTVADWGEISLDTYLCVQVADTGHLTRMEFFDSDQFGDAIVRLYELGAAELPPGRSVLNRRGSALTEMGWDVGRDFSPDVVMVDHRRFAFGTVRGPAAIGHAIEEHLKLFGDIDDRIVDVIALDTDALVVKRLIVATDREGGGAIERSYTPLYFMPHGRFTHVELFDSDDVVAALARLDELRAEP